MIPIINSSHTESYVYIAYNINDDADVDNMFRNALSSNGFAVWHRHLCLGDRYESAEEYILSGNCVAFILVLSSNSDKDIEVLSDFRTARENSVRTIVVKLEEYNESAELRALLRGLSPRPVSGRTVAALSSFGKSVCDSIIGNASVALRRGDGVVESFSRNSEKIALPNAGLSDISPLALCGELQTLALYQNLISDLSPLSGLTKLKDLNLRDNRIERIDALSSLTELTTLTLGENAISDITPLGSLRNLTTLYLNENRLNNSAITVLSHLANLQFLSIKSNDITDPSQLVRLTNIQELIISRNGVKDEAAQKLDRAFGSKITWK